MNLPLEELKKKHSNNPFSTYMNCSPEIAKLPEKSHFFNQYDISLGRHVNAIQA